MKFPACFVFVLMFAAGVHAFGTSAQTYHVNSAKSRTTIHVGKAGPFSFMAGHTHEVSGPIQSGSVEGRSRRLIRHRVLL